MSAMTASINRHDIASGGIRYVVETLREARVGDTAGIFTDGHERRRHKGQPFLALFDG